MQINLKIRLLHLCIYAEIMKKKGVFSFPLGVSMVVVVVIVVVVVGIIVVVVIVRIFLLSLEKLSNF